MLPLRYLAQRDVTGPFLVMMVLMLAIAGVSFVLTQYFPMVQGRSALTAGLYIMPAAGTMMAGAGLATQFSKSARPKLLSIAGGLVVMAGMAVLTLIEVDPNYVIPAIGLALFGLGMVMPTVTDTIMAAVRADDAGLGSALNDTSREFGFALGGGGAGQRLTSVFRNNVTGSLEDGAPAGVAESVGDSLGSLGAIASEISPEVASSVVAAANQAFVDAMGITLVGAIGFVGLSIAIAVLALPRKARQLQAEYAPA